MNHLRITVAALAATSLLAAEVPASAAPSQRDRSAGCPGKMTFLVWPHGHPAIPAIGFAKLATPHVEIYSGSGVGSPGSRLLAWVAAGKTAEPSPSTTPDCLAISTPPKTLAPLGTMSVAARTTAISCSFPAGGEIAIEHVSGGKYRYRIRIVLSGGRLGAQADVTPAGVKFHYPAKRCLVVTPPAP